MALPTTANLPTRQQLDEIDALLRRMLTLPPLTGEPAAPPPPPPANITFPTPIIREVPPPKPPGAGDPVVQSWRVEWQQPPAPQPLASPPSMVAWGSPVAPPTEAPPWAVPAAATVQPPYAMSVPPISALPPGSTLRPPAIADRKPTDSLLVLSLIVLNGVFNLLTYLLGPLGTWLRGSGRLAMGGAGILMIVAAAVWALGDWYGFDWPKPNLSRLGLSR